MEFLTTAHTDVGIKKNKNQDSLCIKIANTNLGKVALIVVCDGMGGLEKGELASATVIRAFSQWFEKTFPEVLYNGFTEEELRRQWENLVQNENHRIKEYGVRSGVNLGTTVTAFLIANGKYYIMNVGDSRAYEIAETLVQITKDQTLVAREVQRGYMTAEQAKVHPKRNILLQCVGASNVIEPEFFTGVTKPNAVYMLCTDGFVHEITDEEIYSFFNSSVLVNEEQMKANATYLVELNKQRLEQDNISVALIRTF